MISVVIPARDEVHAVAGVVRRVREVLTHEAHEILVVDDGSRDGTGEAAREAGARVLVAGGHGYGAAIKAGAAQASISHERASARRVAAGREGL